MICTECQAENSFDAIFCDHCGARLETACPECGEPNRGGATFCKKCGQRLDRVGVVASKTEQKSAASDVRIPEHLAEKILASRDFMEGERKQVTILFADIKGSTKLIEKLDPEEVRKLLDPALQVMMAAVHRYEGTVNQVLGDGIMALFGAPVAHEDHALRACYAALAMHEDMRRYSTTALGSHQLRIGVGLNSGEVVVRSITNDLNVDYSAIGPATHLAARMEEMASPDSTLMTRITLREVEDLVQVEFLGDLSLKGFSIPVATYKLTGVTSFRKRLHAAAARGLTGFVGRNSEIQIFGQVLQQAKSGHGQILALLGEPGMGKSRLVYEFTRSYLPAEWKVLEGISASYGKATPYYPLIELFRRYLQIREGESDEAIRTRVEDYLVNLDSRLTDAIPPVLALLGALPDYKKNGSASVSLAGSENLDITRAVKKFHDLEPRQRRRATLEALKRILIRESLRQPLILLMEDLHWIDGETQAFLDGLVESLPMARIILLVNYRPGYIHSWGDKTYYTLIRLNPLSSGSAHELLRLLLGSREDLAALKELLINRTEGNPFFLEECVRSLVETGALEGEKGAYRLVRSTQTISVPGTVQAVLAERIDRLSVEEKQLLQTAAVIGVEVPLSLLRAVSNLPEERLYRYLSNLQSAEFLYETSIFPELEYSFKHALTNEVVYGFLLHDGKTLLHARIVGALEEMARDDLENYIETLARHALRGELWDKAVVYLTEAGAKAVSQSSFRNAVLRFEHALEALRHMPDTPDNLRRAVDLRIEMRNALFMFGDFQQGIKYLEEARAAAVALNDQGRLGTVFNLMTAHWQLQGNSEQAIASAREALNHTKAPEHLDLHIVANYFLGVAHHNIGQYDQAVGVLERALSLIGDRKYELFGTTGIVSVVCRAWLVRGLAQLGKFSDGISLGEEAITTALERNHPYSIVYAYYGLGVLLFIKGDFEKAVEVLTRGLEVCESADIPVQRPLVTSFLGSAYAFVGRCNEALQLLDRAVEDTAWSQRMGGQALRMACVSAGYMVAGRLEAAEAFAGRGLEFSRESKDQGSQAWLLCILGNLASRRSPFNAELVKANCATALNLAQELGMRPLQGHCHLALGNVSAQVNDRSKARAELLAAVELYRVMSMPFWQSKAETALAELS